MDNQNQDPQLGQPASSNPPEGTNLSSNPKVTQPLQGSVDENAKNAVPDSQQLGDSTPEESQPISAQNLSNSQAKLPTLQTPENMQSQTVIGGLSPDSALESPSSAKKSRVFIILAALILIALLVAGGLLLLSHKSPKPVAKSISKSTTTTNVNKVTSNNSSTGSGASTATSVCGSSPNPRNVLVCYKVQGGTYPSYAILFFPPSSVQTEPGSPVPALTELGGFSATIQIIKSSIGSCQSGETPFTFTYNGSNETGCHGIVQQPAGDQYSAQITVLGQTYAIDLVTNDPLTSEAIQDIFGSISIL